ncbi:MAG: sulfite exporter TauE/SafE family protein [Gemmatimonadota bacterium]
MKSRARIFRASLKDRPAPDPAASIFTPYVTSDIETEFARTVLIVLAAAAGGAINSIAGGGTLLTFPALVGLGVPPLTANATNTVALVPGSLSSFIGYRRELAGAGRFAAWLTAPSILGGLTGALLLLVTPNERFDAIVPWLVIGATTLFIAQRPLFRWLSPGVEAADGDPARERGRPPALILVLHYLVAIYGGYFGAGLGILVLAMLGFLGFRNIHRMNGLKSFAGMCTNLVAAATFAASGIVDWPVALAMSVGAIGGGYGGSLMAQKVPQDLVRAAVVVIGLASGIWLFF